MDMKDVAHHHSFCLHIFLFLLRSFKISKGSKVSKSKYPPILSALVCSMQMQHMHLSVLLRTKRIFFWLLVLGLQVRQYDQGDQDEMRCKQKR